MQCSQSVSSRGDLVLENLVLRQQVAVLKRLKPQPRIRPVDRLFWIAISRLWKGWKDALFLVQPQTVIRWHRKGFRLFWKCKSRHSAKGRKTVSKEIKHLMLTMAEANPLWGAPRIHGELLKLGIDVSEKTVSNLIRRYRPKPPSQTWKTFLKNHAYHTFSADFFTVPTAAFRILFVFIVLNNTRRKIVHCSVTSHPSARWTAQQMLEACPWDTAPRFLIRDRDSLYGEKFQRRLSAMGIRQVLTAPQSPWQNPYAERVIGSIRRECLDHVIVFNSRHLKKILSAYVEYYNHDRTHLGIDKDPPLERPIQPRPKNARIVATSRVGGLHHRYDWKQAA
jgi:putative transposase